MSLSKAVDRLTTIIADPSSGLVTNGGKLLLHTTFPNDFEYYIMGFEVLKVGDKGVGRPVDRFLFPVLPENITINKKKILDIKKTAGGIVSYQNNTFEPININISGTFGRMMRLTFGNFKDATEAIEFKDFQIGVKTGYGLTKRLEQLYEKSGKLDGDGRPYKFIFYNLAFNDSYVVELNNLSFTQTQEKNMMWNYNLAMTAVAPAKGSRGKSLLSSVKASVIANSLNDNLRDARFLI